MLSRMARTWWGYDMALYRSISRDFFSNADIAELTPVARLLYVATWLEADREGRLVWHPRTLKLRYLALDACDINLIADELVQAGLVVTYEAEGKILAYLPGFASFQVINNKERASQLPPPPPNATGTRPLRDNYATGTRPLRDSTPLAVVECNGMERSVIPSLPSQGDGLRLDELTAEKNALLKATVTDAKAAQKAKQP